jgi:hypothetical protein
MATINVRVSTQRGVESIVGRAGKASPVADTHELGKFQAAVAYPLSLVHEAATSFGGKKAENALFPLTVWVPRSVDEELGFSDFEAIELGVAQVPDTLAPRRAPRKGNRPHTLPEYAETWLVEAIRKAHADHFAWKEFDESKETEADIATFILVNSHGLNGRPDEIFLNDACLGWIEDERGQVLVTDLYEMTEQMLSALQNFAFEAGLRFSVSGTSSLHPSKTFRISIWKG